MRGTRQAAKRAEGTRRWPLRVRRGTRAGAETLGKGERGERGLEEGGGKEGEEGDRQGDEKGDWPISGQMILFIIAPQCARLWKQNFSTKFQANEMSQTTNDDSRTSGLSDF